MNVAVAWCLIAKVCWVGCTCTRPAGPADGHAPSLMCMTNRQCSAHVCNASVVWVRVVQITQQYRRSRVKPF